jgi:hypothetical protein
LERVVAFYRDGLGLPELGRFSNHDGYDGVMLGLPGAKYHLEFTSGPLEHTRVPSKDDLLVLYIPDPRDFAGMHERLVRYGCVSVVPQNPYWRAKAVTFEDPDGWRVVIASEPGIVDSTDLSPSG